MNYRAEIDGLRAIAVLPVILFHAGVNAFGGGFVGVDVFFVISGYLITSIILNDYDRGSFSLIGFYERRARRILPALFVVIAACIPVAWIILSPGDFSNFRGSVVAAATFWSNIYFWSDSGYFAAAAELKPLLHTWSLAVEEQFYVFFPLFVLLTVRFGKSVLMALLALGGLTSLAIAQWGVVYEPSATFYLLPTRCWELFMGAGGAVYVNMKGALRTPALLREVAGAVGLALIAFSIFWFDRGTAFPGIAALAPTVGTVLIILFATSETFVGRLLSWRGFVGAGLISYSAYLWHQPLLAFAKYASPGTIGPALIAAIIVATFALSYITWRWVEKPVRARRGERYVPARFVWAGVAAGCVSFVTLGVMLDNTKHYMAQLTPEQKHFHSFLDYGRSQIFERETRYGQCFLGSDVSGADQFDKDTCLQASDNEKNFLLLGDSHASQVWSALNNGLDGVNVMQANASGCRPTWPLNGAKYCTDLLEFILEEFLPSNKVDGIILSARWEITDARELLKMSRRLSEFTDVVIVLGPSPEFSKALPSLLVSFGQDDDPAQAARIFIDENIAEMDAEFKALFANGPAQYLSLYDAVCERDRCVILLDDEIPIIWDDSHFTLEGARWVVDKVFSNPSP